MVAGKIKLLKRGEMFKCGDLDGRYFMPWLMGEGFIQEFPEGMKGDKNETYIIQHKHGSSDT